ncbi:DUF6503 family protein, partial [Roseivirga sp. UBA1976]|uniref:DUF6503 family protein n=1 Tax=Roseivirga sp. UBA1976 TaxID=1947386 RepID=UPI00257A0534|tara:strand:+ start:551 stop:1276 length:726 start_codon:yes stop_codon:yes gene_type:complete
MRIIVGILLLLSVGVVRAQEISGEELLKRAIQFHDPGNRWSTASVKLIIDMQAPNRPVRRSEVSINNSKGSFYLRMLQRGQLLEWMVDGRDSTDFRVDFLPPADSLQADSLSLTPERARRWRNYYSYLYGLPMKLKDPGTRIDPTVLRTQFAGLETLQLKVSYDAQVGKDTWYFYFKPETYEMVGYRFYHNETANDGEYIVLEGMEIKNGLRIPKNRTWYTNADHTLLGTDYLVDFKVNEK